MHQREKEEATRRSNRQRGQLQKFQLAFTKLREDHQKLKMNIKDEISKVGEENLKQQQEMMMKVFSTCLETRRTIESLQKQDEDRAKVKAQLEQAIQSHLLEKTASQAKFKQQVEELSGQLKVSAEEGLKTQLSLQSQLEALRLEN